MSISYLAAKDEIFGVANAAWQAAASSQGLTYTPKLTFPGQLTTEPPTDEIYCECSFVVVTDGQASLASFNGVSVYEASGLFVAQIYAPKADITALRIAEIIGAALRSAFRKPSPSGEVWFRNQRLSAVSGNTTKNQINVVITCVYRTAE